MKKMYLTPAITMVEVKIEKGFAASGASDGFSIQNFEDAVPNDENSAW